MALHQTDPECAEHFEQFACQEVVNEKNKQSDSSPIAAKEIAYQAPDYLGYGRIRFFLLAQGGCEPQLTAHAKGKTMKPKTIIKLAVDGLMTLALLFLMGYHFWGNILHEWVGAGMFVLFIVHHMLNGHWYKTLFKGKYNPLRILMLCTTSLVLVSMLAQLYSGILMSRYVFDFLPFNVGLSFPRRLHILGAYWGFLLMSLHLGFHWNMILGRFRKAAGVKSRAKSRSSIAFVGGLVIALYGLRAFIGRDFPTYLLLKSEFVFLDYNEAKILFYADYLALMGLCIFIAHYSTKLIQKLKKKTCLLFFSVLMCFGLAACAEQKTTPSVSGQSSQQEQSDVQTGTEISENHSVNAQEPTSSSGNVQTWKMPETGEGKVKLTIDGQEFDVTLYDTPAANALYDMLPLELTFEDFNGIEKIAYIDNELPTEGEPDEFDPDVGDLCLYAPWGNLSIFYKDFRISNGLISLGHIDSGMDTISGMKENFSVLLEKAE